MAADAPTPFKLRRAAADAVKAAADHMQAQLAAYPAELDAMSPRGILVGLVEQHLRQAARVVPQHAVGPDLVRTHAATFEAQHLEVGPLNPGDLSRRGLACCHQGATA